MGFHDFRTLTGFVSKHTGLDNRQQCTILRNTMTIDECRSNSQAIQTAAETVWADHRRPYYNVYKSMLSATMSREMEGVKASNLLLPIDTCVIRLPIGSGRVRAVLYNKATHLGRTFVCAFIDSGHENEHVPSAGFCSFEVSEKTISDVLSNSRNLGQESVDKEDMEDFEFSFRLIWMIALIGNNPDLIQPIPLNKDAERYSKTLDPALIEKAKRKGLYGFDVGKHVVCAPGFRRPHFGIRWTEKGKAVPRLVPIKGSVVMRHKMAEIPTGYMDDDEQTRLDSPP